MLNRLKLQCSKNTNELNIVNMSRKQVFVPQDSFELSKMEKRKALVVVNLMEGEEMEHTPVPTVLGNINSFKTWENDASLTVWLYCILVLLISDTYKWNYIAIVDILGAYLHAEMSWGNYVLLKLAGHFVRTHVDMECDINNGHRKKMI